MRCSGFASRQRIRPLQRRIEIRGRSMSTREKTITEFMIEEQRRFPDATGDFTALLNYVRLACKRISFIVGRGALSGAHGSAQVTNVQGETQMRLDVISNDIFLAHQRIRRSPGRDGLRGSGGALPDSAGISARQIPACLRSPGRLQQHRHQRAGGQHILGAEGAARHASAGCWRIFCSPDRGSCAPAMRYTAPPPCWC